MITTFDNPVLPPQDEKNAIFSTSVWLRMLWKDENMKWNATDYGSINELRVNPNRLWVPDIFLINKYIIIYFVISLLCLYSCTLNCVIRELDLRVADDKVIC